MLMIAFFIPLHYIYKSKKREEVYDAKATYSMVTDRFSRFYAALF